MFLTNNFTFSYKRKKIKCGTYFILVLSQDRISTYTQTHICIFYIYIYKVVTYAVGMALLASALHGTVSGHAPLVSADTLAPVMRAWRDKLESRPWILK